MTIVRLALVATVLACACGGEAEGEAESPSSSSGGACEGLVKWSQVCYQLAAERTGETCETLGAASAVAAKEKLGLSDDGAAKMGKLCGVVCEKQRGGTSESDVTGMVSQSCSS
jgi:hypothetical protein